MRTKFALAATTAGLILALGGLAQAAEQPSASTSTSARASSAGSSASASLATLHETKSDDAVAKAINVRAKDLRSMDIYGADGKKIGSVDNVLADQSNDIKAVTADVGGFLGVGSREVVIPIDKLKKGTEKDRLNTALTKAQLETLEAWEDAGKSGSSSVPNSGSSLAPSTPAPLTAPAAPGSSATVPSSRSNLTPATPAPAGR